MTTIPVSAHGIPALHVFQFFSQLASESRQKQRVAELLRQYQYFSINKVFYIQSHEQLHHFIGLLKPKARNGESAEQLRNRFYEEHAYLLQQLPEVCGTGKCFVL